MIQGVDVSNYSPVPTEEQIKCWLDGGIRFVVIGLQNAANARAKRDVLLGRFALEYYIDVPGRDLTIPGPGSRVWIDIEVGCFVRLVDVAIAEQDLLRLGFVPGIYGNRNSIRPVLGPSTQFSHLPLMYADYRDPDWDTFVPFNGWTSNSVVIWQYHDTTNLCGIDVDLDVMRDQEQEEHHMIRHNREASPGYWRGRQIDQNDSVEDFNARSDLDLPANVSIVMLDVWLDNGWLDVHDGDTASAGGIAVFPYAGSVGGSDSPLRAQIVVFLNKDGRCYFKGHGKMRLLGCVGYWKE